MYLVFIHIGRCDIKARRHLACVQNRITQLGNWRMEAWQLALRARCHGSIRQSASLCNYSMAAEQMGVVTGLEYCDRNFFRHVSNHKQVTFVHRSIVIFIGVCTYSGQCQWSSVLYSDDVSFLHVYILWLMFLLPKCRFLPRTSCVYICLTVLG